MAAFVVSQSDTVLCMHGGQAQPATPLPRVTVDGRPAIGQSSPYTISGCPLTPPSTPPPCVTANWVVAATRVMSSGVPLLINSGTAVCVPTGTGLQVVAFQTRVQAT
jgi:hypothetical protein